MVREEEMVRESINTRGTGRCEEQLYRDKRRGGGEMIMSSGNRTGHLCKAELMGHKRVLQRIYREVCICEQERARGAYSCHMSWYISLSL